MPITMTVKPDFPVTQGVLSLLQGLFTALLAVLLVVLYRDAVAPAFGYMGFVYQSPDLLWFCAALLLLALMGALLPVRMHLPSDLFVWLFFVIVVVPSLTIPLVSATELPAVLYAAMAVTMSVALFFFVWFPRVPGTLLPQFSVAPAVFWWVVGALLTTCLIILLADFRAGLGRLLSLSSYGDLYSLRYSYREQASGSFFLSPYLLLWTSKVLVPLVMAWGVVRKRWLIVLAAVVLQLLMFSISGHKSFLLSLVLVAGVLWLFNRTYSGFLFLAGLVSLVVLSAVLFYVFQNDLLVNVVVRRALMVPGMLTGFYYEYFHNHGLALYSQNFLAGWTDSVYTKPPAFEVGYQYFGREETSSNVHFWADAFANLGYAAVLVVTALIGLLLLVVNALSRTRERLLIVGLFTVPFWTLMESSLNTTLLSHGLLLALLIALLVPEPGSARTEEGTK